MVYNNTQKLDKAYRYTVLVIGLVLYDIIFIRSSKPEAAMKKILFFTITLFSLTTLYSDSSELYPLAKAYPPPSPWLLANSCAACHGTNGAAEGTEIPPLAGMDKDEFVAIMQAYKSEKIVKSSIMTVVAKQLTDEEITSMGGFFAKQSSKPWTPANWRDDVVTPAWATEKEQ